MSGLDRIRGRITAARAMDPRRPTFAAGVVPPLSAAAVTSELVLAMERSHNPGARKAFEDLGRRDRSTELSKHLSDLAFALLDSGPENLRSRIAASGGDAILRDLMRGWAATWILTDYGHDALEALPVRYREMMRELSSVPIGSSWMGRMADGHGAEDSSIEIHLRR